MLLIDDERELTSAVRRSLQRMHDVEVASSGADALARIERGERFDIVFCDLVIPQMTGAEVHRAVELISPAQAGRFVFVTGASRLAAFTAFLSSVANARIEKPFQMAELEHLIERHLGR